MGVYDRFKPDVKAEAEEGVELEFEGTVFVARRAGGANKKYQDELRKLTSKVRRMIANDTLPAGVYDDMNKKAYARAVIITWFERETVKTNPVDHTITGPGGEKLPYNEENFVKVMSDLPDLWEAIQDACTRVSSFRAEEIETQKEQLANFSSGSGNGPGS